MLAVDLVENLLIAQLFYLTRRHGRGVETPASSFGGCSVVRLCRGWYR